MLSCESQKLTNTRNDLKSISVSESGMLATRSTGSLNYFKRPCITIIIITFDFILIEHYFNF